MGIGAAVIGSSVLGAGASIFGSSEAASAQEKAAQEASQTQLQMFNEMRQMLQPYVSAGNTSESALMQMLGLIPGGNFSGLPGGVSLTSAINPTMSTLENLPGYQFQLQQGLQATQNGYAAQGLGTSGAALKGAANYSEDLAASNWQNYISTAMSQQQQIYNMLMGPTQIGEGAAAGVGSGALQTGQSIGSNIIGGANAQAAGILGATGAVSSAANQFSNPFTLAMLANPNFFNGMFGGGGTGGGSGLFGWGSPD